MFSVEEKQKIAKAIDDVIKEINHPEMDNYKPDWSLKVFGKENWSWANIHPNHEPMKDEPNSWNEVSRQVLTGNMVMDNMDPLDIQMAGGVPPNFDFKISGGLSIRTKEKISKLATLGSDIEPLPLDTENIRKMIRGTIQKDKDGGF